MDLGTGENSGLPLDQRLAKFQETPEKDPALVALVYHFGRYLLITSR